MRLAALSAALLLTSSLASAKPKGADPLPAGNPRQNLPLGKNRTSSPVRLFEEARDAFWRAEPKYHAYHNPIESLPVLPAGDPAIPAYLLAAERAEAFLRAQTKSSEGTPIMVYFAAMSYSRLGNHAKAIEHIERLLTEFPDYKRPRLTGATSFDHELRAELLHLRMWHSLQVPSKPLGLEDLGRLARQVSEIEKLRADRDRTSGNMPDLDSVARTSDMLRTAAIATPVRLVQDTHDSAIPRVAKEKGSKVVRDYLRTLSAKPLGTYFADYAGRKLIDLDKIILKGYRDEAQTALRTNRFGAAVQVYRRMMEDYAGLPPAEEASLGIRNATVNGYRFSAREAVKVSNFDGAKANWRRIIAEFEGSPEANEAEEELKKLVPMAVKYYQGEADKNFKPGLQIGVPQAKAREFYEKMYREDPAGPSADYAYLRWSRAMGTENKIEQALAQLARMEEQFPESRLEAETLTARAFLAGSPKVRRYEEAVSLLKKVADKHPKSPQAPEALWHIAFWSAPLGRYQEAILALQKLKALYPESRRVKFVAKQIEYLQGKQAAGTR